MADNEKKVNMPKLSMKDRIRIWRLKHLDAKTEEAIANGLLYGMLFGAAVFACYSVGYRNGVSDGQKLGIEVGMVCAKADITDKLLDAMAGGASNA